MDSFKSRRGCIQTHFNIIDARFSQTLQGSLHMGMTELMYVYTVYDGYIRTCHCGYGEPISCLPDCYQWLMSGLRKALLYAWLYDACYFIIKPSHHMVYIKDTREKVLITIYSINSNGTYVDFEMITKA